MGKLMVILATLTALVQNTQCQFVGHRMFCTKAAKVTGIACSIQGQSRWLPAFT